MASQKILESKENIVKEITDKVKSSESVILFAYQGLTVSEMEELRNVLRENEAEVKIYKNTLVKRALDSLNINMETSYLEGPNAIVFGKNLLEPIKIISKFAKEHEAANVRIGILSGEVADLDVINKYATIPSRDTLLTQLASGMMAYVRDLSIALNLYAESKEN